MILRSLRILITGDLMLRTYFAALVSFALPLSFGALFRFVPLESFWLIPLFLPCTALLRLFYRKASCRSLEIRDFALTLIFAALCALMLHLMGMIGRPARLLLPVSLQLYRHRRSSPAASGSRRCCAEKLAR